MSVEKFIRAAWLSGLASHECKMYLLMRPQRRIFDSTIMTDVIYREMDQRMRIAPQWRGFPKKGESA